VRGWGIKSSRPVGAYHRMSAKRKYAGDWGAGEEIVPRMATRRRTAYPDATSAEIETAYQLAMDTAVALNKALSAYRCTVGAAAIAAYRRGDISMASMCSVAFPLSTARSNGWIGVYEGDQAYLIDPRGHVYQETSAGLVYDAGDAFEDVLDDVANYEIVTPYCLKCRGAGRELLVEAAAKIAVLTDVFGIPDVARVVLAYARA